MIRISEKMEGDSLFLQTISALRDLTASFFARAGSLPHLNEEIKSYEEKQEDPLSYVLLSLMKPLEETSSKLIAEKRETRLAALFSTIARIAIAAGSLDTTLSLYPIDLLGKGALAAERAHLQEAALKGQILLTEIIKELGQKKDIAYQEVKTPFLVLIGYIRSISEEIFRSNKQTPIKLLKAPFEELKNLFSNTPWKEHPDTPILLSEIEKTEASFEALETILRTMPQP
jgi:hypothetical protein